jgi:hypothetical protein
LKSGNHRRKQIENKVSSLEIMQLKSFKKPKDFNNARQESLTRFDQPKKKKKTNKNQSQQWKTDRWRK